MNDTLLKALNWRYATKKFDPKKKLQDKDLQTILEAARLSPSHGGTEPWYILVVVNQSIRAKLREAAFGQPQLTNASHLLVLTRSTLPAKDIINESVTRAMQQHGGKMEDYIAYRQMLEGTLNHLNEQQLAAWTQAQSYIMLGVMITAASLLGVDNGPIGGFSPEAFGNILHLTKHHQVATAVLALGYRDESQPPKRTKIRRPLEKIVSYV